MTEFAMIPEEQMKCPDCFKDCRPILRQALASCQDEDEAGSFRAKMLEWMNAIPKEDLDEFLDRMSFMSDEYESMDKNFANTQFEQVKNAIASRIADTTHDNGALYEYLISEHITNIPFDTYITALTKYVVDNASIAQLLNILRRLLERKYASNKERHASINYFVDALVLLPAQLPTNSVYSLVVELLEHKMVYSADTMLLNTRAVHSMKMWQVFSIIKHLLDIDNGARTYMAKEIWVCNIYLHDIRHAKTMLYAKEYLARLDAASADTMGAFFEKMYLALPHKPAGVGEAKKIIERIASDEWKELNICQIIYNMAKKGVLCTLMHHHTPWRKRRQVLKSMFNSWDANTFIRMYMCFPESIAGIETDMCLLRWLIEDSRTDKWDIDSYFILLAQRSYFGYGTVLYILNMLSKAEAVHRVSVTTYIRLLLSAKRQSFLDLNNGRTMVLFKMLKKVRLFDGIAILESHSSNGTATRDAIIKGTERTRKRIPALFWHLQLYIMRRCADTHFFAIWCKSITYFVEDSLERLAEKKVTPDMILSAIGSICGSEYFAEKIPDAEVARLVRMLLRHGSAALRYIDAFLMAARSPKHIRAAKMELYMAYTAQPMTEEEAAAISAMGFEFAQTGPGCFVLDEASMSLDKMIDSVDEHRLLKLVRDKMK